MRGSSGLASDDCARRRPSPALRGAVDGRGEPGGAGADDDEVVVRELLVGLEADPLRDLGRIGATSGSASG